MTRESSRRPAGCPLGDGWTGGSALFSRVFRFLLCASSCLVGGTQQSTLESLAVPVGSGRSEKGQQCSEAWDGGLFQLPCSSPGPTSLPATSNLPHHHLAAIATWLWLADVESVTASVRKSRGSEQVT